jgi:hypothetical protein
MLLELSKIPVLTQRLPNVCVRPPISLISSLPLEHIHYCNQCVICVSGVVPIDVPGVVRWNHQTYFFTFFSRTDRQALLSHVAALLSHVAVCLPTAHSHLRCHKFCSVLSVWSPGHHFTQCTHC